MRGKIYACLDNANRIFVYFEPDRGNCGTILASSVTAVCPNLDDEFSPLVRHSGEAESRDRDLTPSTGKGLRTVLALVQNLPPPREQSDRARNTALPRISVLPIRLGGQVADRDHAGSAAHSWHGEQASGGS